MANYIDPAFQLGMMLGNAYGNMWAANAKKRQGAKADDIINEMKNQQEIERIANMRSTPAENAAQAVVNDNAQRQAAQAAGQITGLGNIGVNKGVDYMGMGAQFAEPQDPFKLSVPSAIDALKSPLGKERALNNAMQATAKDYQQQASLAPAQRKSSNWNPNYTEDNVRNRLKQAGINKEVIDEKMGEVKSDIAQRARDVLLPSIMQNLYGTVDEKGNYKSPTPMDSMKAMIDLQTLAQYDPATAKMLSAGAISPKDIYNEQLYDKRYEQRRKDALKDAEERFNREVALKSIVGYNNRGPRSANTYTGYRGARSAKPDTGIWFGQNYFANIKDANEMAKEWLASDNPRIQQAGRELQAAIVSRSYNDAVDDNRQYDVNNYNDMGDTIQQKLDAGTPKEKIAADMKQIMGDGPMYRQLMEDYDIVVPNAKKQSSKSSSSSWFPDWGDASRRKGLVDALGQGDTVVGYLRRSQLRWGTTCTPHT